MPPQVPHNAGHGLLQPALALFQPGAAGAGPQQARLGPAADRQVGMDKITVHFVYKYNLILCTNIS